MIEEYSGVEVEISFIGYESLIPRARNTFVARFLANPKNTHLLFIDGDIMWKKEDVLKLILRVEPIEKNWVRLQLNNNDCPRDVHFSVI